MDFSELSKLITSPSFLALQSAQKTLPYNIFIQDNRLSEIATSPALTIFNDQQKLWTAASPYKNIFNAASKAALYESAFSRYPVLKNQLSDIQNILEPSRAFFSAIANDSKIFSALTSSGVFSAISALSKNISALSAVCKLNTITPLIEPLEYDLKFPDENTVLIDDEILSTEEVSEIAREFETLPTENSNRSNIIGKLKSKKARIFLGILGFILSHLFFEPLIDEASTVAREYLGIDKILEKIDIRTWAAEIHNISADTSEQENETTENNNCGP